MCELHRMHAKGFLDRFWGKLFYPTYTGKINVCNKKYTQRYWVPSVLIIVCRNGETPALAC